MESPSRRFGSSIAAAIVALTVLAAPIAMAQQAPIVLFTSKEQIPLKAYAEFMRSGILQLVSGTPKDIPTITDFSYFRCGLTGWAPKGVMVASEELFRSETAERRLLPVFLKPVAVSTVAVRAADLEKPERIAELLRAVKVPEGGERSFFFLILSSGDMTRYYPFRIALPK